LRAVLEELNISPSEEQLTEMVLMADSSGHGAITY
jgi:hypothetical protein